MGKAKALFKKKDFYLIFLIWLVGFFLRIYRLGSLLGFYYDQGRDALRVVDILALKNLLAISPTTGLSGIFLGPLWFYLIAPFYWLGNGDPAVAAAGVCLIESLSIPILYFFSKKFFGRKVGFIAAIFWTFSYSLIRSARWFSNPSPMPTFSLLLIWSLLEWLINKKEKWLLLLFFSLAVSSQFEAASAIFYYPAILMLVLIFKVDLKKMVRSKFFLTGLVIFLIFLTPQLAFEAKNKFLMTRNFLGFLTGRVNTDAGKSWALPNLKIVGERVSYFHRALFINLDPRLKVTPYVAIACWLAFYFYIFIRKEKRLKIICLFLLTPLFFLFFFVGNYGNLYNYCLIGFYPIFIILFAYLVAKLPGVLIFLILFYFFHQNLSLICRYFRVSVDQTENVTLGNQEQVIEWVCQDRGSQNFNVDTYVPPVTPYAWDYLWYWYGGKILGCYPEKNRTERLYTVWEVNTVYPENLKSWLERQAGIGKIDEQNRFGGIGVERRRRISNE